MRTTEVELYSKRKRVGDYEGSLSIIPGNVEVVDFMKPCEVLLIPSTAKAETTIYLKGDFTKVERYIKPENGTENVDVANIETLNTQLPILLNASQEIRIKRKTGRKTYKEMWIWIDTDDDDSDDSLELPIPEIPQPVLTS